MKLYVFSVLLALLVLSATAALPKKQVVITYPSDTPDSVLDEAKLAITSAVCVVSSQCISNIDMRFRVGSSHMNMVSQDKILVVFFRDANTRHRAYQVRKCSNLLPTLAVVLTDDIQRLCS